MTTEQGFVLRVPREWLLTANQRLHWRRKAERTKWLRQASAIEAASLHPYEVQVRCEVTVFWPDRRRRDVHNLMPTIKACIDGVVDASLLPDDSDRWLVGPDLRVNATRCHPRTLACAIDFNFTEVSEAAA